MVIFRFYKKVKLILASIFQIYFRFIVRFKAASCGNNLRVIHKSSVTFNTFLGDNVNFQGMTITGSGKVTIGNNFHSGSNCIIMSHYHNYENSLKLPYDNSYIVQDVTIEDNVWIGLNVIVLPGVTLGEGSIIQAGSVVVNSIPPLAIAGGHPAKVFKYRNSEHYFKLKQNKQFH